VLSICHVNASIFGINGNFLPPACLNIADMEDKMMGGVEEIEVENGYTLWPTLSLSRGRPLKL